MNQTPDGGHLHHDLNEGWIDAIAGRVSLTGHGNAAFRDAMRSFADESMWDGVPFSRQTITEQLQSICGDTDGSNIADALPAATQDQAMEWALVLSRRSHASQQETTDEVLPAKCLCLVGGDHGRGVVARMASGRADLRGNGWPLLPGFVHAPADSFLDRIDSKTAIAVVSPIALNDVGRAHDKNWLTECRKRCDQTGTHLVIDHCQCPPAGNGHLFLHEMIARVHADAVLMAAGLTGGLPGALLVLSKSMTRHADESMRPHDLVGHLIAAALQQVTDNDWLSNDADAFAVALAERIASRGSVRDLQATGSTVVLEMDIESKDWIERAETMQLRSCAAGDHAVLFQPPLASSVEDQTLLINRIDAVLASLESPQRDTIEDDRETTQEPIEQDNELETR